MHGIVVVFFTTLIVASAALPMDNVLAEMPENCLGKSYCFDKTENYPQNLIDKIINDQLGEYKEIGDNSIQDREGVERSEDDCERDIKFDPIYEIIDKDGNVRFVAQSKGIFTQLIRTESCKKPGRIDKSRFFDDHDLTRWNFICSEKRIEYSFLALSLDGNSLEDVEVEKGIPVCCSCRLSDEI